MKSNNKQKPRDTVSSIPNSCSPFSLRLRKIDSNFSKSANKDPHHFDNHKNQVNILEKNREKRKKPLENFGDYFQGSGKKEVTKLMRAILINWMGEVAENFYFKRITLHIAVAYLDKYLYLTKADINRSQFQLLGITCLFLASKFEVCYLLRNI